MHRDDESESPVSLTQEALEPSWVSPEVKNSYALPGLPPDASFEAVHAHCISGGISAAELEALCARFLQEHPGAEVIEQFHSRTAMAWEAQGQLELALSEYESSIEDGKFAKPVEYQDSRGFVLQAQRMFEGAAPELGKADAAALERIRTALAKLKAAWPAPMPPSAPVLQPGEMSALVSDIELHASRY